MKLTQLTEIVKTANKKTIINNLKELGFFDCKKHNHLRHLNLETLFKGNLDNTETFPDKKVNAPMRAVYLHKSTAMNS